MMTGSKDKKGKKLAKRNRTRANKVKNDVQGIFLPPSPPLRRSYIYHCELEKPPIERRRWTRIGSKG